MSSSTSSSSSSLLGEKEGGAKEPATLLLSKAVSWAKNVSGFSTLTSCDQVTLLVESWNELFLIIASETCLPSISSSNVQQSSLDVQRTKENIVNNEERLADFRYIENLISWFQDLNLDLTEMGFLKAVLLYKPDTRGLKDSTQVQELLDQVLVRASDHYQMAQNKHRLARFYKVLL